MNLKTIVTRVEPSQGYGFNSNFFVNSDEDKLSLPDTTEPKRRGRPPSKDRITGAGEYVPAETSDRELSPLEGNISYRKTYSETDNMLSSSIRQIDNLSNMIQADLAMVRASKTLKNKYNYVCELSGTVTGLMGSKISAIREKNSIISKCHDLDMKRVKEMKIGEQEDDDKKIMDMYNAFLNVPIGAIPGQQMPFGNITPMQINSPSSMGMIGVDVDSNNQRIMGDTGYDNYVRNMTPEQNAMALESNPYIKPVVVYNQETQDRYFDVVDMSTGQSVANVPRPADFLLNEMRIDVRTGVARNSSANMEFPVVLIGNRAIDEY